MSIYLAAAVESPARVARNFRASRGTNTGDPIRWLFLGRNYDRALAWEAGLGPGFERISYGRELQALASEWRGPYLDWLGRLGERHDSLEWWTSAIAERNTMDVSLYHSICYLQIALRWARPSDAPLLIVAESLALLEVLAADADLAGRVRWIRTWRTPLLGLRSPLRGAYRWTAYFADAVLAQLDARVTRASVAPPSFPDDRPRVLLHSCLDESYFGPDGTARDRYFPQLIPLLRDKGYDVVTLPWLFNLQRTRRSAFRWFRRHGRSYLIPEDYYRLSDYVWAAGVVVRQARLPTGAEEFQGLRIDRLVREARRQQLTDPSGAKFIRYYRLVKRIARQQVRVDVFVDMFENLASEKASVLGFRQWMPNVVTLGYQHCLSMIPLKLNFFISPTEARVNPLPDVIVAGSPLGAEQLAFASFPADRLRAGPTLRFQHLLQSQGSRRADRTAVLVVVPLAHPTARELVTKLIGAFRDEPDVTFWLKLHPMMSARRFQACLGGTRLPGHFTTVGGELSDWFERAGCVVVMASLGAFETALKGVPVVVVGSDTDFDFNPLAWFPEFPAPADDAAELRRRVRYELGAPDERRRELEAWAARMLERAVSPITDEGVMAFVTPPSAHVSTMYT